MTCTLKAQTAKPVNESTETLLILAENKLLKHDYAQAEHYLHQVINAAPESWKAFRKNDDGTLEIAFWNKEEYESYLPYFKKNRLGKDVQFDRISYSKAYYLLAQLAVKQENFSDALYFLNHGLDLEPDHPALLSSKAMVMHKMGYLEEAHELYINAIYVRQWVTKELKAKAMRGAGIILSELRRLNEAVDLLKQSLKLDPSNSLAMNELSYIYLQRINNSQFGQRNKQKRWWKFW